jgi:uncharacterized protein YlxW (UPF0749 family)
VAITVGGRLPAQAVQDLVNELRTAGAEAIAIGDVRVVPATVVTGAPGGLSLEGEPLEDPFEIRAIGPPETLTGSLTRSGGIVAQLAATEEQATLTVTPLDRTTLAPTTRDLEPRNGRPRL